MSNALAIASVTFVLMDLLNNGMIDRDVSAALGDVSVSALPPDRIEIGTLGQSQLNLFLYQVTPNQGWRNVGLPIRNAAAERIGENPLALDLHYLLTAYGAQQLHAEILLGYAMQLLHETPVLTRAAIRRSLAGPSQVAGGGHLPDTFRNLYTSELSEQVEMVKLWPQTLTTEEISRLWTAFQARYRPTAAYQASVVLIESRVSTKSSLPVQSRAVHATPSERPNIDKILSRSKAGDPFVEDRAIVVGDQLVVRGSQLKADDVLVRIGDSDIAPADTDISSDQILITIPSTVQAGLQPVQVFHRLVMGSPPAPHVLNESNVATFKLRPRIDSQAVSGVQGSGTNPRSGVIDLLVSPAVGAQQTVKVLLNQLAAPSSPPPATVPAFTMALPPRTSLASPPASPPDPSNSLHAPFSGVPAGNYLLRVVVDGAESPLQSDVNGAYGAPQVTIP
ncbi:MAG: DUF4255 domain-containing protein [Terriglobales bacterium]